MGTLVLSQNNFGSNLFLFLKFYQGDFNNELQYTFLLCIFQFFDRNGDGTVTQADVSCHFAISSVVCNEAKKRHQERQQPFERLGSDVSYQNCEGTIPNEMNVGEFI